MITPDYVRTMAAYCQWQNGCIHDCAAQLDDAERRRDRGAFFGSIHGTLCHLLWGDRIWMHRLAGWEKANQSTIPGSVNECEDWDDLVADRSTIDARIVDWAGGLTQDDIDGELSWHSAAAGRALTRPRPLLLMQLFNHQTHHRGQVHAMLTAAGVKTKDTDIPFMPGLD